MWLLETSRNKKINIWSASEYRGNYSKVELTGNYILKKKLARTATCAGACSAWQCKSVTFGRVWGCVIHKTRRSSLEFARLSIPHLVVVLVFAQYLQNKTKKTKKKDVDQHLKITKNWLGFLSCKFLTNALIPCEEYWRRIL